LFSRDGGSSWDTLKLDIHPDTSSYTWVVPETATMKAKIRIIQDNETQDYEDTSSNFTINTLTGTMEPSLSPFLNIYPNPVSDYMFIEFENPLHKPYSLKIYDMQGKVVRTVQDLPSGKFRFERRDLTAGIYLIRLFDEQGISAVGRIILE
jgi:hypothetical protein